MTRTLGLVIRSFTLYCLAMLYYLR